MGYTSSSVSAIEIQQDTNSPGLCDEPIMDLNDRKESKSLIELTQIAGEDHTCTIKDSDTMTCSQGESHELEEIQFLEKEETCEEIIQKINIDEEEVLDLEQINNSRIKSE